MPLFSRFVDGLLLSGGVIVAGAACLYLSTHDYFPSYMRTISYGIAFSGMMGLVGVQRLQDDDDDPGHDARMAEFNRLRPQLEAYLRQQAIAMLEFERVRLRYQALDRMEADSSRFGQVMDAYERRVARRGRRRVLRRTRTDRTGSLTVRDIRKLSKYY